MYRSNNYKCTQQIDRYMTDHGDGPDHRIHGMHIGPILIMPHAIAMHVDFSPVLQFQHQDD